MKKVIASFVIAMAFFGATTVFAQGLGNVQRPERPITPMPEIPDGIPARVEFRSTVAEVAMTIRQNNLELRQVRQEIAHVVKQIQEALLAMESSELTEEQIAEYRETLRLIHSGRRAIAESIGQIRTVGQQFRGNRFNGDYEAALENLERVIAIQNARLVILETMLEELQDFLAGLE